MKRPGKILSLILVIAFVVTNILAQYETVFAQEQKASSTNTKTVKNEIIVKYKDESKKDKVKQALTGKLSSKIAVKKNYSKNKIELLEIDSTSNVEQIINELKSDPNVQYAQPNYKLNISEMPSDARFPEQWGLYNIGQTVAGLTGNVGTDIHALDAWSITKGNPSTVVGVLDTGVDINHPDLKNNIFTNEKEIPFNGIDDDGNGYIDDVNGYDFANNDNTVYDGKDVDKHGTEVAGIIGASANSEGVRGVAPNVKILPLKFINGSFGYTSDAIEAIEYAKNLGVKLINCSWGGAEYNLALKEAMENSGILFIAAAGNNSSDVTANPVYPTCFDLPNVVSAAAIDNKGALASFSNYGSKVTVTAPGVNILSTLPGNSYGMMNGTSAAAPFVTGAAALFLSVNPNATLPNIKEKLEESVTKLPQLSGKIKTEGMVNSFKMLEGSQPSEDGDAGDTTNDQPIPLNQPGEFDKKVVYPFAFTTLNDSTGNILTKISFLTTEKPYSSIQLIVSDQDKKEAVYDITAGADTKEIVLDKLLPEVDYTFNLKYFNGNLYQSYLGHVRVERTSDTNENSTLEAAPLMEGVISEYVDSDAINSLQSNEINSSDSNTVSGNVGTMAAKYETEPNGSFATANTIYSGDDNYGKIGSSGDADYYRIQFDKTGKVRFWMGNVPQGKDYDIYLYDEAYNQIGKSTNSLNADETIDGISVQANKMYYIKVGGYNYSYDANANYWLRAKLFPTPTVTVNSPQNGAIYTLGQAIPVTAAGTDIHHMGVTVNGTYMEASYALGNNLTYNFTPSTAGTYKFIVRARNTESETDLCTALVESTTYVTVISPNDQPTPIVSGAYYKLTAKHSGKALDVYNASMADAADVGQCVYYGSDNQIWKIDSTGDGYYKLTAKHSGKVLDVQGGSMENGGNIIQFADYGNENQKWQFVYVGNGHYKIVSKLSGKVLDVFDFSQENGDNVQQWADNGGDNQKWQLTIIQGPDKPDLAVTDITWSNPSEGNTVTFSALIKNQGNASAKPGKVSFVVDGIEVSNVISSTNLLAGQTVNITATNTWNAVEGTHTVMVFVDNDELLDEISEGNNILVKEITVGAASDGRGIVIRSILNEIYRDVFGYGTSSVSVSNSIESTVNLYSWDSTIAKCDEVIAAARDIELKVNDVCMEYNSQMYSLLSRAGEGDTAAIDILLSYLPEGVSLGDLGVMDFLLDPTQEPAYQSAFSAHILALSLRMEMIKKKEQWGEGLGEEVNVRSIAFNVIKGLGKTVADNIEFIKDIGSGVYNLVRDPIGSVEGASEYAAELASLFEVKYGPFSVELALKQEVLDMILQKADEAWDGFSEANENTKARVISNIVSEVVLAIYTSKGSGELNLAAKTEQITSKLTVLEKVSQSIATAMKGSSGDFLSSIDSYIIKLNDGFAFRPAVEGIGSAETGELFQIIKNYEISNVSRIDSIAGAAGRLVNITEIAPDIANIVKNIRARGTVFDLLDESGKTIRRVIVPNGYRNTQQLLYKAWNGEIDVSQWGYSSVDKLEEVINNTNRYLNRSDLGKAPSLINSDNAGKAVNFGNGITIEYDLLGFPIFKGDYVKINVNINGDAKVLELGLDNMTGGQHMQAATRAFLKEMQEGAITAGKSLDEYLANMGFDSVQIQQIKSGAQRIDGYSWHHHQETGRMQLVERSFHQAARHNGGNSLWGEGLVED